ncbi:hypothetical protein AWZ03_005012 [Drosophila navojoa]|uniref:CHK kinase-like domain-containing protein n=1 Tax=Drosophila navojoa TaxID=7232 RepID=A0A484BIQ6_DRONA|nr:hypothetical protein AWZ03_005012 [Drosophila navojoa]
MELLSPAECLHIALRTLQLKDGDENLILLKRQLEAGSTELMGYMGEYYKLHLELEDTRTKCKHHLQYFVKSLPYKNPPQRAECERKGVFRKETSIYKRILPHIQRYGGRDDVMVLEDLTQHYRHLKANESYSQEHYKLVLGHLAALHAASIAWEEAEQFNIGERYKNVFKELLMNTENEWFITGLKGIVFLAARHVKYQTERAQTFIREELFRLLSETEHLVKPSKSIRNVLCHRDTWDRNILFGFDSPTASLPSSCCLVDFQLTQYCSPSLDVLFLLYILVPSAQERRNMYDQALEYYYDALQAEFMRLGLPANLISRSNFLEECERTRLAGLTMKALTEPQTKMLAVISNKLRSEEPEKFDFYLNCDRSEMYLRVMQMQPGYEETIMEPIAELVDYLMERENVSA